MKNITIVGGGACGSAVFIELVIQILAEELQEKVRLTLIEKDKKIGYGLAFGTQQKSHLLNTQADLMGIFGEEPEHFVTWLKEKRKNFETYRTSSEAEETYTSRLLYGDYVAEQFSVFKEKQYKAVFK
ncbi:FAD/NAD(P)-binding protein [Aquimarina celericrescens]|nr:FAD/NAD(P)-binding protein [Aquimarina celericrescens]